MTGAFTLHVWRVPPQLVPAALVVMMTFFFVRRYVHKQRAQDEKARQAAQEAGLFSQGPQAQHPQIDEIFKL